eukprot:TRINITY_DN92941_c0_g1_i1.p1 TRINITY_DN92941_c0_g1~~TRINITY_DN92941_c0_g1_i1.p1  ORF type:complete len:838 (-),score=269.16 TRINITY_DN92941_c0_g1_i1:58-2481(-)
MPMSSAPLAQARVLAGSAEAPAALRRHSMPAPQGQPVALAPGSSGSCGGSMHGSCRAALPSGGHYQRQVHPRESAPPEQLIHSQCLQPDSQQMPPQPPAGALPMEQLQQQLEKLHRIQQEQELSGALQEPEMTRTLEAEETLPQNLEERLLGERLLWAAAVEQCQAQLGLALQNMSVHMDGQVAEALEAVQALALRSQGQVQELDSRLSMAISDLEVRQQADRTERGTDLMEVRSDLDRQWEELSKGLAASGAEAAERAQQEKHEVLDALAAVCRDIEMLRTQQKEQDAAMERAVQTSRSVFEAPLAEASAGFASGLSRLSAELDELRQQQARQRHELEDVLKGELHRTMVEELQVRRLNELEALQVEDSRHRADIEALRTQQRTAFDALRSEEAAQRSAAESRWQAEAQALRLQLSNCLEALSGSSQLQERLAAATSASSSEALQKLGEELRQELRDDAGRLGERLGGDVAQLRAQLAEGIAEVRSQQVKQGGELQVLQGNCQTCLKELEESRQALQAHEEARRSPNELSGQQEAVPAPPALEGLLRQEDLLALQSKHDQAMTELRGRLGMQGREIEGLQKELLETTRQLSTARQRLAGEVEEVRQERQRDMANFALEMEKTREETGEWSLFKAFSGCRVAPPEGSSRGLPTGDAAGTTDEHQAEEKLRDRRRKSASGASFEDVEVLRKKQVEDAQELRSAQRSFFDEVLTQAASNQKLIASELEAVRGHCNTAVARCDATVAGLQAQQQSSLEAVRHQQRRLEQVQGQLLGDVGALKGQLVESLRTQRALRTAELASTQLTQVTI